MNGLEIGLCYCAGIFICLLCFGLFNKTLNISKDGAPCFFGSIIWPILLVFFIAECTMTLGQWLRKKTIAYKAYRKDLKYRDRSKCENY